MLRATNYSKSFVSSITFFIFYSNLLCVSSDLEPVSRFELLSPRGFRITIQGLPEHRMQIHGNVYHPMITFNNKTLIGDAFGPLTITRDQPFYENKVISIEKGQYIEYYIQSLDIFSSTAKSFQFYYPEKNPGYSLKSCVRAITHHKGWNLCQGELFFIDEFSNPEVEWDQEIRFSRDDDDAEFVLYKNIAYTRDGNLFIKPYHSDELHSYSETRLRTGELDLGTNCTSIEDRENECKRKAGHFRILPPVLSAMVTTKSFSSFQYGKIEVRAKLPTGDWLFPLITLDPLDSEYGTTGYASGQMRVAFIRSNKNLQTKEGWAIDGSFLSGGVVLKSGAEDRNRWLPTVRGKEHFGNEFHTYTLTWTDSEISLAYDGNTYATLTGGFYSNYSNRMAPFDRQFYISLGVSAGGMSDFPDGCVSNTGKKPWENTSPKAELNFWKARHQWAPTWYDEERSLIVDYVKVWAV